MPIVGFGLYFALALFCAVHVVRTGQPLYWLMILFGFPILGSVVYLLAVYLPASRLERGARKVVSAAARVLDPQRDVRAARAAFEETPTAQNQMRLAAALLDAGDAPAAAQAYGQCLAGPFAKDPEIRFGAARAFLECERHADALQFLELVRAEHPEHRPEPVALLTARALAGVGKHAEARAAFAAAEERFGTFEAKAEYAIWAYAVGERATSARLQAEADRIASRWNGLARELNAPAMRRLQAARAAARQV
ncbi:tetratricopeptide repeat protein [Ramlibacter sp. USB13]|uniref:Tetratricopeptide repeat protein n=1 Tax=Ramlibacter cellulosilyticus TaxID=2764187 RepID=A0A923SBN9_9BURK|nr:tetratricopeptide repeat protein [Ramlibacter cellulosilyticus]MBC5784091.1 tetratricopeptide repeat protein [Ramlibacter cellulosilyticus]